MFFLFFFFHLSLSSLFYFNLVVFVGLFNVSFCRWDCCCYYRHTQGCTNARRRVTKCYTVAPPNICSLRSTSLLYVSVLAPRILRSLLDFWKICVQFVYNNNIMRASLFGNVTQRWLSVIYRRFGTAYWSHLQSQGVQEDYPLNMGQIGHPETSVDVLKH